MYCNWFADQNKTGYDFFDKVWVVCPVCKKKAVARTLKEKKVFRLQCGSCAYNKEISMESKIMGHTVLNLGSAISFFGAELWLKHPFKENFIAYNGEEPDYLETYISAGLREHRDRKDFTLLEKLPKFYHQAKNKDALLKIIRKLKDKK